MSDADKATTAALKSQTMPLHQLAQRLKQQHAGKVAILLDLSAIPAIHSRIMFRSMARFIEEHAADEPIDAVPLARNILVMLAPIDAAQRLCGRLEALSAQLQEHRHGSIRLRQFYIDSQSEQFAATARELMTQAPPPPSERLLSLRDAPPPDMETLTRVIDMNRILWQADLSSLIRRQAIWQMRPGTDIEALAEETWVSIRALEQAIGLSLQDDIWLFGKVTELLDQRMIAQIAGDEGSLDYPLSVNFHLVTLVNTAFRRLVSEKPAGQVARMIVEIPLVEWQLDGKLRDTAVGLLRRHSVRICLDGIQPADVPGLGDADWDGADLLKFDAAEATAPALLAALRALPENRRVQLAQKGILCHCDSEAPIAAGLAIGLQYFQGRELARLLQDPAALERLLGAPAAGA